MTRDEALARCAAHNAAGEDGHWIAQQVASGDWRAVRLRAPGLRPATAEGTVTEARPKPTYADDPRTANVRNIPPYGAGF
jgi:hypothetical protein